MSNTQRDYGTAQVQQAHPGLDARTASKVAEQYIRVASETGTPFSEVLADSVRAENSSAAGNDSTP